MTRISLVAAVLLATFTLTDPAHAQLSITWYTIDGGGGTSSGGGFTLSGTIGQPDAGGMSGGSFDLLGGYWEGGPPFCHPDYNHDGFMDGLDYDLFMADFESYDPAQNIRADYNGDGFVDGIDYDQFNIHFEAGC